MRRLETERLHLRRFTVDDAPFVVAILNDAAFIRFIGDREIRTQDDARAYIAERFIEPWGTDGLGPWVVELKDAAVPIGFCTLFRRDWLDAVDLGFAFLPAYRAQGFAMESARAMLDLAHAELAVQRIVAIVSADNAASTKLLGRLGFAYERMVQPPGEAKPVMLFAADLAGVPAT